MKKISLFLMAATLLLSSFFLGCQNNVATDITTGSVQGSVTLNGTTDEVLGLDVFIAGTSFVSKVAADGKYEISNIPANAGYVLCVQKGEETQIIKENVEVKAGEVTVIETATILSSEWIQSSLVWKGNFETAPENPEINWAYFNTTDGCSYIWDGTTWSLLAGAGEDGVIQGSEGDRYNGLLDLIDFMPEKLTLQENMYSNGAKENYVDLPYDIYLPNLNDKITLEFEVKSDKEINGLIIKFADPSKKANYWLDITQKDENDAYIFDNLKAGETIKISHTFTVIERPFDVVRLNLSTYDSNFEQVTLSISNSKISVTSTTGLPVYRIPNINQISSNAISYTTIDEGIKFTGSLLSNVEGGISRCTINIRDTNNKVSMIRDYSLQAGTYETWEMIYPLVEKGKTYNFEVSINYNATTITIEPFTITAIGGLGEYKVENVNEYKVTLSEDKKILSRTQQQFVNNPKVQNKIIDYGTIYDVYSNSNDATQIWDGIWRHGSIHWQSKEEQKCDLTQFDWPSYEDLVRSLKGRKLGVRTDTRIKLAGYTYNNTTVFSLNDEKQFFFDWDDEEEGKIFILYQNPITKEYYKDVPGTSLYYIKEELDEDGNIVFAKKGDVGTIEVYGQLICYGDKINEPVYVPAKIENYNFTGYWNCSFYSGQGFGQGSEHQYQQLEFPCDTGMFWEFNYRNNDCIPVFLSPEYKPEQYKIFFVDGNGNQILEPIVTKDEIFTLPSIPDRENYFCNYWQSENQTGSSNSSVTLTKLETTFVADYELKSIVLNFHNENSIVDIMSVYNARYSSGHEYFYEYGNYISFYNVSTPSAPETDETKDFSHWECQETGQIFSPEGNIGQINTVSTELNFIAVYK